ncbi:hypothetical protein [Sphingomonas glaciei]|uniref:Uncharacterized protein n=1 Tax=Sphingomonas glaciei TaxID=2938948 RepID=A0ABY5MYR9_9SPHN|nr:hypothetical protein [Sphingomonas glaciei]UUR08238.1 hypothetical protein M1K48_00905 [Sphingomonas glaciei]
MADNIDVRVSVSLDPENLRLDEGYNDETAQFVGSVVNAFNDAYVTLGKVHDLRELWLANPAVTKEGAVVIVAKEAEKHRDRVLGRFDKAARDLAANIEHTEKQLMEPLREQAGLGSLNGEVRAYVRGLQRKEREAFMRQAFEQGDEATLLAILGAQSFLSGLTKLDQDYFLREYHTQKRPDLVRRLDVMRKFEKRLHAAAPILRAQFAKAIGEQPGVVAHLQRANEQALAALKIEPTA